MTAYGGKLHALVLHGNNRVMFEYDGDKITPHDASLDAVGRAGTTSAVVVVVNVPDDKKRIWVWHHEHTIIHVDNVIETVIK